MADVADLFLLHLDEEDDDEEEEEEEEHGSSFSPFEIDFELEAEEAEPETLDPAPFWPSVFVEEALIPSPAFFSTESDHAPGSETLDLFNRFTAPQTLDTSDFRALDDVQNLPSDYLGLGLGLGFDIQEEEEEDHHHPIAVVHGSGLRVVGFGSDSESETDRNPDPQDQDPNLRLCWDALRLEEDQVDDDFEWEEVDGRLDERDILSMMVGEGSRSSREQEEEEEEDDLRNVHWEVLLSINNHLVDEEGDFVNPSEYEVLFGQFAEATRGSPPASKSVVGSLKSVILTEEDVTKGNTLCAVCKDEISLEEKAKQLPCLHHYHGDCILPWLGMRNTCPVCRYELPTDDVEYERWKAQRRGSNNGGERYDLDLSSAM